MALKANFEANFNKLYAALDEAEVRFKSTALEGTKLQSAIDKIGDKWSGRKVIEDAALMAASIEKIGGASVLTAAEARRVNATLNEALEKASKTGVEASAAMKKLAADTAGAAQSGGMYEKVINGLGNAAKTAAMSFVAMFAFTKVIEMGKALIDFGGQMTDLSAKTGLSTTALQQFQYAGGQVGVELASITAGVNMMQKRLAGDNQSAVSALKSMGVSVDDFKRMKPEEQFSLIAQKVGSIEDPMKRTKAATDLFGNAGKELLPALTSEFTKLTERANSLGIVMDEQTIASMDTLGDTVSDLGGVAFAALGKIITPLIPLLSTMASVSLKVASALGDTLGQTINIVGAALKWVANQILDFNIAVVDGLAKLADTVPGLDRVIGSSENYKRTLDGLRGMQTALNAEQTTTVAKTKAVAVASDEATKSTEKHANAVKSLRDQLSGAGAAEKLRILEDAFKSLTPAQQQNERVLREVLTQYEKSRNEFNITTPVLEQLFQAKGTLTAKTLDLNKAVIALAPAVKSAMPPMEELFLLESRSLEETAKLTAESKKLAAAHGGVLAPAIKSGTQSIKESTEKTVDWQGSLDGLVKSFEQLANIGGESFKGLVQWMGQVLASSKLAKDGGLAFSKSLEGIKNGGKEAAAAVINLAASAMSIISAMDAATASGNTLQRTIGGVNAGFAAGNAIFPGVGGAIGAVAGGLVGLVRGLTSVSEETKKVRGEIASFEESLRKNLTTTQAAEAAGRNWAATTIAVRDAYVLTGRSAAEAEAIVKQLWDDKNPNAARAAIEKINAVMAEAKKIAEELDKELNGALTEAVGLGVRLPDEMSAAIQSLIDMGKITGDNAALFASLTGDSQNQFKAMEESAKRYGVELSSLGPAFAQNKLNEQAKDIINAFETMTKNGADVGGVIAGMSDEINQFIAEAIKSGKQVPENMRPILEAMIAQGQLTDENGNKLEDLSGINFGPPIESAFDKIIAKLQELIDRLVDPSGYDAMARNAREAGREVEHIFDGTITPAIERAEDAVNGLNFGHSPGGLKEIPILSRSAGDAVEKLSDGMILSFAGAENELDAFLRTVKAASNLALDVVKVDKIKADGPVTLDTIKREQKAIYEAIKARQEKAEDALDEEFRGAQRLRDKQQKGEEELIRKRLKEKLISEDEAEDELFKVREKWRKTNESAKKDFDTRVLAARKSIEDPFIADLQKQKDAQQKQLEEEAARNAEFEGFVIPKVDLITEAAAAERIRRVGEYYGRALSQTDIAKILKAYGYKGGGQVVKPRLDEFLQSMTRKFVEEQYVGFSSGTKQMGSWFRNFGTGVKAVLHGEEAVVPRGQAQQFAEDVGEGGGTVDELRALRADMMALPQHLARAVRDAILVAG